MSCPGKKVLHAYLTPEEYDQVQTMANQVGLSVSIFVKRVCLGQRVNSRFDQQAVLMLLKANADLGRLGGLFKKAISERYSRELASEFRHTLRKIEVSQEKVVACCRDVVDKKRNLV